MSQSRLVNWRRIKGKRKLTIFFLDKKLEYYVNEENQNIINIGRVRIL